MGATSSPPAATAGSGTTGTQGLQFLRFAVGGGHYVLRVDSVREILERVQTTPLPLMPDFVHGVMNLRGVVVPVIDLAARLGCGTSTLGRRSCVVIAEVPDGPDAPPLTLGMLVDGVQEVVSADPDDLEAVPRFGSRVDPAFLRHMVRVRQESTPELDLEQVLDPQALTSLIAAQDWP